MTQRDRRTRRVRSSAVLRACAPGTALLAGLLAAGCASAPEPARAVDGAARVGHVDPATPGVTEFGPVDRRRFMTNPWKFEGREGWSLTTPHFNIYTTLRSRETVDRLPTFYEGCLLHFTSAFGPLPGPDHAMTTYIFRDEEEWRSKTREILSDQADEYMNLGRGGLTTQGISVLFDIGQRDTLAIAAHEGWHQYTQQTFKHPLPIWLEEGIATYMEAVRPTKAGGTQLEPWRNNERHRALRNALYADTLIPFETLLQRSPQSFLDGGKTKLLTYYAQVWALTRFFAEGEGGRYRDKLHELLSDAAAGRVVGRVVGSPHVRARRRLSAITQIRSGPIVMMEYFNADLQAVAKQYEQFIRRLSAQRRPLPAAPGSVE